GHAARVLAAELAVGVVAQVQLQRVVARVKAIAQRQRVLRAVAVDGVVGQLVFAPLQRGGEQVRAQAVFVLPEIAAQVRARQVVRRRGFVPADRVADRQARAVGIRPLRRPRETRRTQAVVVLVVLRVGGGVFGAVVAGLHLVGQQRGIQA